MSIKIIVVLNMLVRHVPFHEYKFLFAIIFFKFAIIFLNTCVPHVHSAWLLLSSNNGFRQVLMLHYYCYQLLMSWQNSYTMEYIMQLRRVDIELVVNMERKRAKPLNKHVPCITTSRNLKRKKGHVKDTFSLTGIWILGWQFGPQYRWNLGQAYYEFQKFQINLKASYVCA